MTTATRTGVFKVERAEDGKKWTITVDGTRGYCPINWGQRKDAVETLDWIKGQAEQVVAKGYFMRPSRGEVMVKIDGNDTIVTLPYEAITCTERRRQTVITEAIRREAMQYFVERASE